MASIFKPLRRIRGPDGQRTTKPYRTWYVRYRDSEGVERKRKGYRDKAATLPLAAEIEREVERQQSGLSDRFTEPRKRPLAEHLADWQQALLDRGNTKKHADLVKGRAETLIEGCKFKHWPEVTASAVQRYLGKLRDEDYSAQTRNFYLAAIKQFARWMVADQRVESSPLAHLQGENVKVDRRHDRADFSVEELHRLITAAENGDTIRGVPGSERALIYRLVLETGLRASEIRSLKVKSFDLEAEQPSIYVEARSSRHRQADVLPIRSEFATVLKQHLFGRPRDAAAFRMPASDHTAKMVREDLAAARAAWLEEAISKKEREQREGETFLKYRDDAGRVRDFHALRHTFGTMLKRAGVHPKDAQMLMRHSTITLTMDRYTHGVVGDLSAALDQLPDLSSLPDETKRQRATGTLGGTAEGAVADGPAKKSAPARKRESNGAQRGGKVGNTASCPAGPRTRIVSPIGTQTGGGDTPAKPAETLAGKGRIGTDRRLTALVDRTGEGGIRTPGTFRYSGFQDRRLQPLGHLSMRLILSRSREFARLAAPRRPRAAVDSAGAASLVRLKARSCVIADRIDELGRRIRRCDPPPNRHPSEAA